MEHVGGCRTGFCCLGSRLGYAAAARAEECVTNKLYYGDNLDVLRNEIRDESVDLVYLDPPFNSNANYNILFKSKSGDGADAQIEAFEDTWHWNDHAEDAFDQVIRSGNTNAAELLRAMRAFLGENDMMAYLAMMAVRLIELHRALKLTGSLYLHCDPTASHYLKLLLDGVFGPERFGNEISWRRSNPKSLHSRNFANCRDVILRYTRTSEAVFNPIFGEHNPEYVRSAYKYRDEQGRSYRLLPLLNPNDNRPNLTYEFLGVKRVWRWTRERMQEAYEAGLVVQLKPGAVPQYKKYLDDSAGRTITNDWSDILPAAGKEILGYPTQKPVNLLERVIAASSNEGDVILDPFCGCGTAVHAAQKLGRQWIGIDVTHLAISLIEKRLKDAFPGIEFEVHGTPKDLASAEDLAQRDKYQFQWWAVSMVDALPFGGKKKGADGGVDGVIYFKPDGKRTEKALVSVKGGSSVSVNMIRDLHSAMEREKAPIGVFITSALPTRPMETEAAAVGRFEDEWGRTYPRLQIITLAELFQGKKPQIPFVDARAGSLQAQKEELARQGSLL
jgi:adenine specific DNA methylase Mod